MELQRLGDAHADEVGPVPIRRIHLGERLFVGPRPDSVRLRDRVGVLKRTELVENLSGAEVAFGTAFVKAFQGVLGGEPDIMDRRAVLKPRVVSIAMEDLGAKVKFRVVGLVVFEFVH